MSSDEVLFQKWHGLGNDFLVLFEDDVRDVDLVEIASAVCDRHRGVGADGILITGSVPPSMKVINADGSVPEMCGNGLRCVAGWLARKEKSIDVETIYYTDAGKKLLRTRLVSEDHYEVTVDMGIPSLVPRDAGVIDDHGGREDTPATLLSAPQQGGVEGYVVSVGNPHWIFLGVEAPESEVASLMENDPRFTQRTNVEWVERMGPGHFRVRVWERGCGWTQACGSGAVAVARVLALRGEVQALEKVRLSLPGGDLICAVSEEGAVAMTGPAEWVYDGVLNVQDFRERARR